MWWWSLGPFEMAGQKKPTMNLWKFSNGDNKLKHSWYKCPNVVNKTFVAPMRASIVKWGDVWILEQMTRKIFLTIIFCLHLVGFQIWWTVLGLPNYQQGFTLESIRATCFETTCPSWGVNARSNLATALLDSWAEHQRPTTLSLPRLKSYPPQSTTLNTLNFYIFET